MHYRLRQEGMSDSEAQFEVYKSRGLLPDIESITENKFPYEHGDFITLNEKEDAEKLGFQVNKTNIEGMFKILKKERPKEPFGEIHPNTLTTVRFAYKDFKDGNVTSKTINNLIESIDDSENSGRISDSNYLKDVLSYVSNYSLKPTIEPIKRSGYTENIGDVYGADSYIGDKLNIQDLRDYEENKNEYKRLLRKKLGDDFVLKLNEAEELMENNYHYTLDALNELGMVQTKKFTKEQEKSRENVRINIIGKIQDSKDKLRYLNRTISTPKSKLQAINDVEFWEKQLESMSKR